MAEKRVDRRIRRTKRLLRQALAELMNEKEFKDITVKEITERADLNRGTFYFHYTDTYDLKDKIENELVDVFRESLDSYQPTEDNGFGARIHSGELVYYPDTVPRHHRREPALQADARAGGHDLPRSGHACAGRRRPRAQIYLPFPGKRHCGYDCDVAGAGEGRLFGRDLPRGGRFDLPGFPGRGALTGRQRTGFPVRCLFRLFDDVVDGVCGIMRNGTDGAGGGVCGARD